MAAAPDFKPQILGFLCNWCSYAGADLAGVSRYQFPPNIRIIRLMCSGRMDLEFVMRAFANGKDGVYIGGCWIGECHYVTEGNYDALSVLNLGRKLLEHAGINPNRLRLEWVSASEGVRYAEVVTDFTTQLKEIGPIGVAEGIDKESLKLKLEAITRLLPFIKLMERQKLRTRFKDKAAYDEYFNSDDFAALFKSMLADRLAISQITVLLKDKALSQGEIADRLGMSSSEVSKHLLMSSRQKLVRFDAGEKRYALA